MRLATTGWIVPTTVKFSTVNGQRMASTKVTMWDAMDTLAPSDIASADEDNVLDYEVGEILKEFCDLAQRVGDKSTQQEREDELEDFVTTFGWLDPEWPSQGHKGSGTWRINVNDFFEWAAVLDEVIQSIQVTDSGSKLDSRYVDDLAKWPKPLNADALRYVEEIKSAKPARPELEIQRGILGQWLNQTLEGLPVRFGMNWTRAKAPEFEIVGQTMLATLVLKLAFNAGIEKPGMKPCAHCRMPFTPREAKNLYCSKVECKREQQRRQKQRQRNTKGKS
jgi:hypothetical protein